MGRTGDDSALDDLTGGAQAAEQRLAVGDGHAIVAVTVDDQQRGGGRRRCRRCSRPSTWRTARPSRDRPTGTGPGTATSAPKQTPFHWSSSSDPAGVRIGPRATSASGYGRRQPGGDRQRQRLGLRLGDRRRRRGWRPRWPGRRPPWRRSTAPASMRRQLGRPQGGVATLLESGDGRRRRRRTAVGSWRAARPASSMLRPSLTPTSSGCEPGPPRPCVVGGHDHPAVGATSTRTGPSPSGRPIGSSIAADGAQASSKPVALWP